MTPRKVHPDFPVALSMVVGLPPTTTKKAALRLSRDAMRQLATAEDYFDSCRQVFTSLAACGQ